MTTFGQLFHRLEHAVRSDRAVDADHVGAHRLQDRTEVRRIGARNGSCRRSRPSSGRRPGCSLLLPDRVERRPQLLHVAEGLEDDALDSARQQSVYLSGESRRASWTASSPNGSILTPERSNGTEDHGAARARPRGPAAPQPR